MTHIGLDIGETALITGCALKDGSPTGPFVCDGSRAKHLRKEMHTTLKRLQERDAAEWRIDERFDHYQNALTDIVEKASRRAVEYARRFEKPVLVMENLTYIREELDYGSYMNRRLHAWAFARLQNRVEDKARELVSQSSTSDRSTPARRATLAVTSETEPHKPRSGVPTTGATSRSFRAI